MKDTKLYSLYKLSKSKKRYKRLSTAVMEQVNAVRIDVINFNATNLCNSACVMCNVWKNKERDEISTENLYKLLQDSLFDNVKHIGITGGEPTLRKDLPAIFETIIQARPTIQGLSLITNCIKNQIVIDGVNEVRKVCAKYNIPFSMMVSLDGVGKIHDEVRGRKDNFPAAIHVLDYFIAEKIDIAFGCTISKINVWEVDELLDFAKENKYYGRFRVAEFINRLHNNDRQDVIRNFTEEEKYHLILFLYKLIFTYETNETFQRTYYSIISILNGGKRLIGCPYHSNGIMLDYNGDVAYCAPKSKIIGNAVTTGASELYQAEIEEKERILKSCCDNCIHDYHAEITGKEAQLYSKHTLWQEYIRLKRNIPFGFHKNIAAKNNGKLQLFITGWYGTETVGDKAILGGIIDDLNEKYGFETDIIVASLYPIITEHTVKELNINVKVVDVYSEDFVAYAKGSDMVIMGGGPIMDIDELAAPLLAFRLAKLSRKKTIIYGSGLGPLTKPEYVDAAKKILQYADEIMLRDEKSVALAKKWTNGNKSITCSGDFAKKYLMRFEKTTIEKKNVLTCFLRDWTYEYKNDISQEEFVKLKEEFEKSLAFFIKQKAIELNVSEIRFDNMHNFVIGNDDRDFARRFIKANFQDFDIPATHNKRLSTVETIVGAMKSSKYNICMRFHSVLFADTLQTDYVAIDYTLGGKIYNYLKDNNKLKNMVTFDELIEKRHR